VASNNIEVEGVTTGTWHHIVATMDRSGYLRGYLDGVEFETPLDISAHSAVDITSDENALIGKDVASAEWNGKVGDLKIYQNTVLSASQVTELYNDSKVIIPSNVSQTNLMGWWPLAEGAGTLCYDGSGNGRTGTITNGEDDEWLTGQTGAPQLVEGYNKVMLFDGSSDYVGVEDSVYGIGSFPTGTTSRTIAAWVWWDDATLVSGVFGYGTSPSTASQVFEFYSYGASGISLHYASGNSGGSTALSSKTWYHLAGTYDGTTAKVYINGALDHTDTIALATVSSFARFGCINYAAAGGFFKGIINEVVFYDTELSLAQVQALAATGPNGGPLPPDPMSLSNSSDVIAYWRNDAGYLAGNVTWKNRAPGVVKNFIDVATDPINDSNSVGSWTNNGTSLTSVTGGRWGASGTPNGGRPPRYRLLFDSGLNQTVNSIREVTAGKTYKVSAWYLAGTVTSAMLRVANTGGSSALSTPVSLSLTSNTTSWTNKTAIFTPTVTGNVTIELHNRAIGTQYFDDVSLIESGPALDGTSITSPDILFFKQGYNGSGSTSTGRDNQGFPLLNENNGAIGFNGSDNYIVIDGVAPLMGSVTDFTISCWAKCVDNGANQILVAVNGAALGTVTLIRVSCDNANKYFDVYDGSGVDIVGTTNVADGNWHYFTYVRVGTGTDEAHIYVDGVLQNSGTHVTALSSDDLWSIGQEWDAGPVASQFFNGQIANVQVYNRALSVAEITQNINAQRSRFI